MTGSNDYKIAERFPDPLLSQFSRRVAELTGLHFPKEKWSDLARAIGAVTPELGCKDADAVLKWLASPSLTQEQVSLFASHLTVGETYFFRDKRSFQILEERILPALIESRRASGQKQLRIWSAACSSGEEPYSIAILLDRMLPDIKDWRLTILATDINHRALEKASGALYNEWSFRDTPPWLKGRYFKKSGKNGYALREEIKRLVTFESLNLTEDFDTAHSSRTKAMDLIFCRNVLIYFVAEYARSVVQKFHGALSDGGWLVTSAFESAHLLGSPFTAIPFEDAIFYRKESGLSGPSQATQGFMAPLCLPPPQTSAEKLSLWLSNKVAALPLRESPHTEEVREILLAENDEGPADEAEPERSLATGSLYERGDCAEGKAALFQPASPDNCKAEELALLARSCANAGNLAEALEWCERAIVADKFDAALRYLRATILLEEERVEEAVASLKRALYLDQNFALAHFALGGIARRRGREKEAAKYFQNALALLRACQADALVPESEGLTAGRLIQLISTMSKTVSKGE
jgi:chemotaxis protein methyltransferase CheR